MIISVLELIWRIYSCMITYFALGFDCITDKSLSSRVTMYAINLQLNIFRQILTAAETNEVTNIHFQTHSATFIRLKLNCIPTIHSPQ